MDQHVANLDFGENSMSMAQSAFVSMMADQGLNGLSTVLFFINMIIFTPFMSIKSIWPGGCSRISV